MSHTVKIYDTCIGCTQCVRACPTDVLEMVPWDGCKSGQIASSPRVEDCVGCKRCETACPTDFLSVRVYLGAETTRSFPHTTTPMVIETTNQTHDHLHTHAFSLVHYLDPYGDCDNPPNTHVHTHAQDLYCSLSCTHLIHSHTPANPSQR